MTVWSKATPERVARPGIRKLLADATVRAAAERASVGLLTATPAGKPLQDATGWTSLADWQIHTQQPIRPVPLMPTSATGDGTPMCRCRAGNPAI